MSIGAPSSLGTLLIQRLDAVLGTTLSQQTNIVSGARPDAVSQPAESTRAQAVQNELLRHPRQAIDQILDQTSQKDRQAINAATKTGAQNPDSQRTHNNATNATGTPSAPTRLGPAAKTILALLTRFPDTAPPVIGKTLWTGNTPQSPLLFPASTIPSRANNAPGAAAQGPPGGTQGPSVAPPQISASTFMQALSQAVQNSGIFYESHLNRLAFGTYDTKDLLLEPQARLKQTASMPGRQTATGHPNSTEVNVSAKTDGMTPSTPDATPVGKSPPDSWTQAPNVNSRTDQAGPLGNLHPDTFLLVRQQLEVLANQAFAWRAEAWPGAPMQWEVSRHNGDSGDTDPHEAAQWSTRLLLTLPRLGELEARIHLKGTQIDIQLAAPKTADILHQHAAQLRTRCLAGGIQLGLFLIKATAPEQPPDAVSENTNHDV